MTAETYTDPARFAAELLRRGRPPAEVRAAVSTAGRFKSEGVAVVLEVGDLMLALSGRKGHRREHRPAQVR